jgi:hypothetical protein
MFPSTLITAPDPAPKLGQYTEEVLCDLLRYDPPSPPCASGVLGRS